MAQDTEKNKKVEELAELLAQILVEAIDEGRIKNELENKENE